MFIPNPARPPIATTGLEPNSSVTSPGTVEPLQIVINNLYQLTNKDGITAGEFDTLEKTASEFDAYQMTAYEFDSSAKAILV